jgi:uncharacterized NAD(P)/FAD-binding protein YdhS
MENKKRLTIKEVYNGTSDRKKVVDAFRLMRKAILQNMRDIKELKKKLRA